MYTKVIFGKASGPTLPENNPHPSPFAVLVTGASQGVGRHIALAHARAGVSGIIVCSRTQTGLESLKSAINTVDPSCDVLAATCDITSPADLSCLTSQSSTHCGRLDAVVASAGSGISYLPDGSMPHSIVDDLEAQRILTTNMIGTSFAAQHCLLLLIDMQTGVQVFVAITSASAYVDGSSITPAAYNISKLAVNRLVVHIAADGMSKVVQTFAVHAGTVSTEMSERNSLEKGDIWDIMLVNDVGLCGGWLT